MTAAYQKLLADGRVTTRNLKIATSHYYVRFLPSNELERNKLLEDSTLEFFDYPLDYEILRGGLYYQDPSIPDSMVTWQYTVIPVGKRFPSFNHEVLAELYIPEEVANDKDPAYGSDPDLEQMLVNQALLLVGDPEGEPFDAQKNAFWNRPPKWNPSGRIRVFDNEVNAFIPVRGAKVRARRWFIFKKDLTDANGNYQTGSFRRAVHYSIKWERGRYDIRKGSVFQAYLNGPKLRAPWNRDIARGGSTYHIAHMHRGAERYFYGDIGGLRRPGIWTKLKIAYISSQGSGVNWGQGWQLFLGPVGLLIPNIKVWGYSTNSGNYKDSERIFSTTIHEIAHSSHIKLMSLGLISFAQVEKRIYESWATCIEWYVTDIEYRALGINNYGNPNNFLNPRNWLHYQRWDPSTNSYGTTYTPLFIDFVDDFNQSLRIGTMPSNRCPVGGTFDGANCEVGTPPSGENAFIWDNNFYYTPVGANGCPYPGSFYDGANCYVNNIPNNHIGFVHNNKWYYFPAGNDDFPYDQVRGYTMSNLEKNVVKHSYGMTSLRTALKQNKPTDVTDRQLDVYLSYY
ncbi:MAG: hypothetical protein AAFR59_08390 [Bacteroidota bacterium]